MAFFDGRGVAYSYESTVPAPLLPSSDRSYNLLRSYRLLPWSTLDLCECPRTQGLCKQVTRFVFVDTKARPGDVIDLHSDSRKPVAKIYQICRKKILSASEGNNIRLSTNYNKISNK